MKLTRSLAELQHEHVTLELECIDRMYLNAYVPQLTTEGGIAAFCRGYLGRRFASTKQAIAMTETFVKAIHAFIQQEGLELVHFQKGQRKDDVFQQKLRHFKKTELLTGHRRAVSPVFLARNHLAKVVIMIDPMAAGGVGDLGALIGGVVLIIKDGDRRDACPTLFRLTICHRHPARGFSSLLRGECMPRTWR